MIIKNMYNVYSRMILLFMIFIFYAQSLLAQNATIKESVQEFKTYPFFDPNPVANIDQIYPYFKFDGYSKTGHPKKWKVVTLENPFIKVFILPEIGGKVWGALDKATNKMFIYYNHVIKFRDLALRGPWTSGGIEINFGIMGHSPTCSTPVDYITKKNDDGSVSCIVSSMDLPSRTVWNVEIRLPKDEAYFETNLFWHNPTGLNQSYYHWLNGSAKASDDLQFFYPGHYYLLHNGSVHNWPVDKEGHNLALYKDNNFGTYKPYHIIGAYSDFFGCYYHKDNFGTGHWSNYTDKPGKKLWIWGLSREGMIWENLLTDTDGQYIELQSGTLFNQAHGHSSETPFKQKEFIPLITNKWSELWFPIEGTEGIKTVSPLGTFNYKQSDDKLKIYFSPLQLIDDNLTVEVQGKVIYKKHLSLAPLELFVDSLELKSGNDFRINIGQNKFNYSSQSSSDNYLHRPLESPVDFDWNSVQGLAIKAREESKERLYDEALENYKKCLDKDPNYVPALTGIAELYFRRMDYDSALTYAKKALSIDTYDGAANFIYGLTNQEKNLRGDAKDGFSIAAQSVKYRTAAFTRLAEMYAEDNLWAQSSDFAQRAIDYNRYNISAYQILISGLRKQNKITEAKETIEHLLKIDPLNHYAMFEKYLLEHDPALLKDFKQLIRGEFPSETFLELAITYYHLGLLDESLSVLENAPSNPIVFYWEAYLLNRLGETEKSKSLLNKAEAQSAYLVFPFRYETVDVLKWALDESSNWKNKYYLALIYWNKGKIKKARELFVSCNHDPDYLPFYLTRGKFFENTDVSYSINDYHYAVKMDSADRRAWLMLTKFYERIGDYQNSFKSAEAIYKQKPDDYRVAVPYAKALYNTKQYQAAINVLENLQLLPNEGRREERMLYNRIHLMLAITHIQQNNIQKALEHLKKAKLWPENLGAGKPYNADEIVSDFLEWYIWNRLGEKEKSSQMMSKLDYQIGLNRRKSRQNTVIAVIVLRKEGKNKEALELVRNWIKESIHYDLAQWTLSLLKGDDKQAKMIFEKIKDIPEYRMFFSEPIKSFLKEL